MSDFLFKLATGMFSRSEISDGVLTLVSRRKVAAIGGMSAQIPIKGDEKANDVAMNKVRADKLREVTNGHDGTWIAHPLINKIALEVFDQHMLGPNQVLRLGLYMCTALNFLPLVSHPSRRCSRRCC
jgi:hypothetical protein